MKKMNKGTFALVSLLCVNVCVILILCLGLLEDSVSGVLILCWSAVLITIAAVEIMVENGVQMRKSRAYSLAVIVALLSACAFLVDFSDPTGNSYSYAANYSISFKENGRAILTQSKEGQRTPYCRTEGYWRRDDEKFIYLSGFSNGNCPWVQRDVDSHKFVIDGGRLVKR